MRILILLVLACACALPAWAHGDEDHDDDALETIVIGDVEIPAAPTYHEHARPILEAKCASCHQAGQIAAYAPLTDAQDAIYAAPDIKFHVLNGLMPPWLPSRANRPLKYNRSLSDLEIATLAAWVDAGAALGDPAEYAPAPTDVIGLPDIRADLTLQLETPYSPAEEVLDDYRCFAFPLDIAAPQFITGYAFLPGVMEMAHHAILFLVDSAMAGAVAALDGADGAPGWTCYGSSGLPQSGDIIAAWAPGSYGIQFPAGTGYRIEPGQIVVMQMHYNLWTTRQPDQTQVRLQLEPGGAALDELVTIPLSAPVEIPCPSGVDGPQCEREAALDRIAALYGEEMRGGPDRRLRHCRQTLAEYADNTGENARGYCDFPNRYPQPLTVFGVAGHMHELGISFRMELNPESEEPLLLLDIPRWDFHWQDGYEFVEPVRIKRGDTLRITCAWDNALSESPRYVVWGEGTADEMCFATLMALKQ